MRDVVINVTVRVVAMVWSRGYHGEAQDTHNIGVETFWKTEKEIERY
jgi:hypothetical protein